LNAGAAFASDELCVALKDTAAPAFKSKSPITKNMRFIGKISPVISNNKSFRSVCKLFPDTSTAKETTQ